MFEIKIIKCDEFFSFIKNYAKYLPVKDFYKSKEKNEFKYSNNKWNFSWSNNKKIFNEIYLRYLKKFSYWPQDTVWEQNDYINIELTKYQ